MFSVWPRSKILNLYWIGLVVNWPSTSWPFHSMRTDGVTLASSSANGGGFTIWMLGAIVYEKNART